MARRTLILGVLAGSVATALVGGIAWAAIPSANGTIRACYDAGGNLKVIDEGKSCAKGWTGPLIWNQQGTPGTPGTDGVSGYEIVTRDKIPGLGFTGEGASCPDGKKVLGGGAVPINDNGVPSHLNVFNLLDSAPRSDGGGWSATWTLSSNPFAENVRVYATCATVD
jgi:hypothetical protein